MKFNVSSIDKFVKSLLNTAYFEPDPEHNNTPAIEAIYDKGNVPLVVVIGPNASGKSFLRRLVTVASNKMNVKCMHTSQEGRAYGSVERAIIYGAEDWESTGVISANSVLKSINSAQKWENKHIIFWDEPDIGLSDDYAAGLGIEIAKFIPNLPEKTLGCFLVTHSKALVREIMKIQPHYLRLSNCLPVQDWLDKPVVAKDLGQLKEESRQRFKRIQKILNRK